jgi:hypothetical protein
VTPEDVLSRLSAGLDRDAVAVPDWMRDIEPNPDFPEVWHDGEYPYISVEPARILRQADVIRKVLADAHDPKTFDTDHLGGSVDYDSFREGVEAATDLFVHALASIYTDEPAETEKL